MSRITFFQNSSDNSVVLKKLTHLGYGDDNIVNMNITEDCSFQSPIFLLGSANFDFQHCNYLYFEDFARYYYIEDIVLKSGNMIELHCREDVLMSFASQIRNIYTIVERQEQLSNCNPYIVDNKVIGRVDRQMKKRTLSNSVGGNATGTHIVLTVTGGD